MNKLNNRQRAEIFKALADARAPMRYGHVTSYEPDGYYAKVMIQGEDPDDTTETGWLPILAMGCGGGWGDFWGLLPGAQVAVCHFEGDRDNGLILGVTPNDEDLPPQVPGGEKWTVHQSGSFMKFTNDGNVSVNSQNDMDFTSGRDINMTAVRNVTITDGNSNSLYMKSSNAELTLNNHTLTQHTHPGVQTGSSSTQKPAG